jgi:hypothetical protein
VNASSRTAFARTTYMQRIPSHPRSHTHAHKYGANPSPFNSFFQRARPDATQQLSPPPLKGFDFIILAIFIPGAKNTQITSGAHT